MLVLGLVINMIVKGLCLYLNTFIEGLTTKVFLCGIWNLCMEKLYPSGSSDLFLHSSINQCVVNGSDAMAAHS